MKLVLALLLLALPASVVACAAGTASDDGPAATFAFGKPFTLARGRSALLAGGDLRITFVEVKNDSRCPASVVCVWAGDAEVVVRATRGRESRDVTLHASPRGEIVPEAFGHRIELAKLAPHPETPAGVKPEAYVVELVVQQ